MVSGLTNADLMEVSNETLAAYASMIQSEAGRRRLNLEAVPVHAGNVAAGKPAPLLIRVIKKVPTLPPADLAKLEALIDGWITTRAAESGS